MICPKCHLGYMLVHAEARGWLKCPLCAFCCKEKPLKEKESEVTNENN